MSRNGSGTYTLPVGNPVVTGTTISSTWANNTLTDIATALTGSLAADGQTTATGNLKMGSNRITGLSDGLASTDAATVSQVTASVAGLGTMSTQNANNVAITGGAIDGTTIGTTTRADGKFTTLAANGDVSFTSTGAVKIPAGTTAQQPTPTTGMIRYNSTTSQFEGYGASAWGALGGGAAGSNTQIQYNNSGALAGSSGLTFNGTTLQSTALQTATLNSTSGVLATQNGMTGIAKAWVQFTGAGSAVIVGSFNVSSVTYVGTGNYTVSFTTSMPNTSYAAMLSSTRTNDSSSNDGHKRPYSLATGSVGIATFDSISGNANHAIVYVAIFSS